MQSLLLLFLALIVINISSQETCNIQDDYVNIFKIEKKTNGQKEYLLKTINELDSTSCFFKIINNNEHYVSYLMNSFTSNIKREELLELSDPIELQSHYVRLLKNDSIFNEVMNTFVYQNGGVLDTVSLDELLNIAVKFFSIIRITEKGQYVAKVCSGINGLKKTESKRSPQVEAFCFSTIWMNYEVGESGMYAELVKGIKQLYKINLGIDESEKLLRAQGAMYMFMKNDKVLTNLMIEEFQRKKEFLPFVLEIE